MLQGVHDIREQFPLSLQRAQHELSDYLVPYLGIEAPGTEEIASELGIRHPKLCTGGDEMQWQPSTDLLITRRPDDGSMSLLAVSVKPVAELGRKRAIDLLKLEQSYWHCRNVPWLLITPDQYDARVADCLRRAAAWVTSEEAVPRAELERCRDVVAQHAWQPLSLVLQHLAEVLQIAIHEAQNLFWQSVWQGLVSLDLRRGWRPSEKVHLLSADDFIALNPLAAGRTACLP